MKIIDRTELDQWTVQQRAFALLDVLPGEEGETHAAKRMPHEHSAGDFLAQMATLAADKDQAVVLYDSSTASISSHAAAGLLEKAGFGNVYHFVGPQAVLPTSAHASPHR